MNMRIGVSAACLALLLSQAVLAQGNYPGTSNEAPKQATGVKMMKFEKGSVTILKELGSIIVAGDSGLAVQMAGPKDMRPEEYKDVDLLDNDRIIMMNGKKLTTIKDFENGYKAIEIGDDVELGVKRANIMMIVSFPKASPDDLPQMQTMMISEGDGEISSTVTNGEKTDIASMSSEGLTAIKPVPGAGLLVAEKEGDVTVMMLLPNAKDIMKEEQLEKGDIIISLQGREVSSAQQFLDEYEKIPVGSKVSIEYLRNGKTGLISFARQEGAGAMELKMDR